MVIHLTFREDASPKPGASQRSSEFVESCGLINSPSRPLPINLRSPAVTVLTSPSRLTRVGHGHEVALTRLITHLIDRCHRVGVRGAGCASRIRVGQIASAANRR